MRVAAYIFVASIPPFLVIAVDKVHRQTPEEGRGTSPTPALNPHWRSDGCSGCHEVKDGQTVPLPQEKVDLLCLSCHDGVQAKREPHPIGRSFASKQVRRPPNWPAPGGLLSCLTCHDILRGCRLLAARPAANPAMLRGNRLKMSDYCAECHVQELHQRHNPHLMLHEDELQTAQACRFCHEGDTGWGADAQHRGEPMLKLEEITLCAQCHREHADFFVPGHIGAPMTHSITETLLKTENRLDRDHPSAKPVVLPVSNSKVTCSTCHNPHQAGVFPAASDLAIGAMVNPRGTGTHLGLRLPGRDLCTACHGF